MHLPFFRRSRLLVSAAAACGLTISLPASAVPLITNGSFDNVDNSWVDNTGSGGNDYAAPHAAPVPGWSVVSGFGNDIWVAPSNSYGLTASPGNASGYFIDLTGEANDKPYGGLMETIATTAGITYALTFDLGASTLYNGSGTSASALTVLAQGDVASESARFSLEPRTTNDWRSERLTFVADSSTSTLSFLADSNNTSRYVGLDNVAVDMVAVAAVPEPTSTALLLAGLGFIGAIGRKRRRTRTAS